MKYTEISHFSHPQHKLRFEHTDFPFKCDGCKEIGIGSRYKCFICDYDLHTHCAIIPSSGVATYKWGGSTEPPGLKKNTHISLYNLYIEPPHFFYCTIGPTKLKPIFTYSFSNFILSLLWLAMNRSNSNKVRDRFDN
jgi:hypothetical protein